MVTRCDGCGRAIRGHRFIGAPGLTELLGMGFCNACERAGRADFTKVLADSPLLSESGKEAVRDWMRLQAPPEVLNLIGLLRCDRKATKRSLEGRQN